MRPSLFLLWGTGILLTLSQLVGQSDLEPLAGEQLRQGCSISFLNRTALTAADGTWIIRNAPASDTAALRIRALSRNSTGLLIYAAFLTSEVLTC